MISNGFGFILLAREDAERELIHLAAVDPLTGLFNRRAFLERANHDLKPSRPTESNIVMLVCDIDHFKMINDTYGHATGDLALQAFARICRILVREPGIVGRMGGEEFAAIFNARNLEDAIEVAENLRQSVAEHTLFLTNTVVVRFTVSIGVLVFGASETLSAALVRADKALYAAKQSGRNKVVVAET